MRNFNENSITGAVLDRIQDVGNSRVGQISKALVRHLHAFVREVRPTQAEWEQGINFLTRTGKMRDDKRQEFILLSERSACRCHQSRHAGRCDGYHDARSVLRSGCTGEGARRRYLGRHGRRSDDRHGVSIYA
jgi:CDGSH-type Zn-finger protein